MVQYRNSTCYTSWLRLPLPRTIKGTSGWVRVVIAHFSFLWRFYSLKTRRCETTSKHGPRSRRAWLGRLRGRFHKHNNNPAHISPAMFLGIDISRGCTVLINRWRIIESHQVPHHNVVVDTRPSLGRQPRSALYTVPPRPLISTSFVINSGPPCRWFRASQQSPPAFLDNGNAV